MLVTGTTMTVEALVQAVAPPEPLVRQRIGIVRPVQDVDIFYSPCSPKKGGVLKGAILSELEETSRLERGWDGQNAQPPSKDAILDARTFVFSIKFDVGQPHFSVSQKGSVGLYWDTKNAFLDILFSGQGTYSYYGKVGEKEFFGDSILISYTRLPEDIQAILAATI